MITISRTSSVGSLERYGPREESSGLFMGARGRVLGQVESNLFIDSPQGSHVQNSP